jgi:hypothetical protein
VKSFLLTMLVGVGLATVAAVALVRAVFPETTGEVIARPRQASSDREAYTRRTRSRPSPHASAIHRRPSG